MEYHKKYLEIFDKMCYNVVKSAVVVNGAQSLGCTQRETMCLKNYRIGRKCDVDIRIDKLLSIF